MHPCRSVFLIAVLHPHQFTNADDAAPPALRSSFGDEHGLWQKRIRYLLNFEPVLTLSCPIVDVQSDPLLYVAVNFLGVAAPVFEGSSEFR